VNLKGLIFGVVLGFPQTSSWATHKGDLGPYRGFPVFTVQTGTAIQHTAVCSSGSVSPVYLLSIRCVPGWPGGKCHALVPAWWGLVGDETVARAHGGSWDFVLVALGSMGYVGFR
jgi:hypothetical protein